MILTNVQRSKQKILFTKQAYSDYLCPVGIATEDKGLSYVSLKELRRGKRQSEERTQQNAKLSVGT